MRSSRSPGLVRADRPCPDFARSTARISVESGHEGEKSGYARFAERVAISGAGPVRDAADGVARGLGVRTRTGFSA